MNLSSGELTTRILMIGIGLLALTFLVDDLRRLKDLTCEPLPYIWQARIIMLALWALDVTLMSIVIVCCPTTPILSSWRTIARIHGQITTLALAIELNITLRRERHQRG